MVRVVKDLNYVYCEFEDFPVTVEVKPGQGDEVTFRKTYEFEIGNSIISAVDIFHGHDRGDTFEMDTTIYTNDGRFVARRIEENESPQHREANRLFVLPTKIQKVSGLKVHSTCRITGKSQIDNTAHPSFKKWRGVFDMNFVLIQ